MGRYAGIAVTLGLSAALAARDDERLPAFPTGHLLAERPLGGAY